MRLFFWFFSLLGAAAAVAQPLPKVQLHRIFPALTLDRPLWMVEAPDGSGRFFIGEQAGRILVLAKGSDGGKTSEFLNIVNRHPFVDNEEGLLSLAFHPGFKSNGLCYISYNQQSGGEHALYPRRSIISELKVSAGDTNRLDLKSERILLKIPQRAGPHKGGELTFGPDGDLYLALGDGGRGSDLFNNAQNSASLLGKVLRIDVNRRTTIKQGKMEIKLPYGIPSDNPFIDEPDLDGAGACKEVYAWGLRNPWRYSWDRQTGQLWVGDVGQDSWEEIDLITKGGNYGWNVREGSHHFKPGPVAAEYIDPVIEYPHNPSFLKQSKFPQHGPGACVIGGYVYRGKKYPALQGVYLYADFVLGTIFGLRYQDGKVTDYGTLLEQPKNIDSFAEDADGELYAIVLDGGIYSISAAQ
ncbi:MAG TPA: PQQ-dependent sugar dehydrogenase [Candidatus Saccharimonadales bacterium]|nr:PQQ-dependent sugar dehydrogenase [Candidatus Saccharimonadales bacterium]